MLKVGIFLLEALFMTGIIGSTIVVVLVAIDDFKEISQRDES
ncbi:MAG TPA: hypothetical protein VG892_00855 [Terriglobales bacterium]|jgi:hypothetical protein|nr:hypothetical protein [Terriglobales bacterium]